MTRLAEGGRAARPGLLWRLHCWDTRRRGILRQHAARIMRLLAAFTDDYPDPGQDTP